MENIVGVNGGRRYNPWTVRMVMVLFIKADIRNPVLNVSYIFTSVINVGDRSVINVVLDQEVSYLDEVVVVGVR